MQNQKRSSLPALLLSIVILALVGVAFVQRQAIIDWNRLRGYEPPAAIAQLVTETTMTDKSKHLFYVNHPALEDKDNFNIHCPNFEKTYVLGCYLGGTKGIYLYDVQDERLHGVEEVTAAHEMLHVAYERLSGGEKRKVDDMLNRAYADITDQRLRSNIDAYQKAGADVANELHSILATEVRALPDDLEQYYAQYFVDRDKVVDYLDAYIGELTSRRQKVADYDAQLSSLKTQIDTNKASLESQESNINALRSQLEANRAANNIEAYNGGIPAYRAAVERYNSLAGSTRALVAQYNGIVEARNKIAVEEQDLGNALDSRALPQTL